MLSPERKAYLAKWREKNREKLRAYHADWTAANMERVKETRRAHYAAADKVELNAENLRRKRQRKERDPEGHRRKSRDYELRTAYGITLADFEAMFAQQEGRCRVCGSTDPKVGKRKSKVMFVDHDHATGRVRGLLCMWCNAGIGHMQDAPELLEKAAQYIEKHAAKRPDSGGVL